MTNEFLKLVRTLAAGSSPGQQAAWRPAADVYRGQHGWLVKMELAGVSVGDIELSVCGSRLTVRGLRRDQLIRQASQSYSMEISYNRFERTLEMPCDLEQARITTEYKDGMLLVHLNTEASP
jgi:HSP20 family protein